MQFISKIKEFTAKADKVKICASGAALVCAAALMITFAVNSATDDESVDTHSASQSADAGEQAQQTQKLPVIKFKKASISEYEMAQKQSISASQGADVNAAKQPVDADFVIAPQDENFTYVDKMNSPAYFGATRDISSEYYTVRDITTGKLVTMNAYELVCGIVYNEVGDGWGAEAIKAQAVAAYSCLRYSENIGMVETVGIKKNYTATIENCVRAVQGQTVMYGGTIANTLYSASTAGYSIPSGDVITSKYPYLTCVKSAYDDQDPNWGRKVTCSKEKVKQTLENKFGITLSDDVKNWFKITDSRYGKYIFGMSIDSKANATGKVIAGLFQLRSSAFDISYKDGTFTFTSYGWGHGVGMSQWGACMYAKHGYTYDQILTHYYVGTRIGLSNVSVKAVQRGKMSADELEKEAESATQTSADDEQIPQQTQADTQPSEQVTSAPPQDQDGKTSESTNEDGAEKVTKSAENAE